MSFARAWASARSFVAGAFAFGALGMLASACTVKGSTDVESPSAPPIAAVHKSKCGGCHEAPEPGRRERSYAAAAMSRHEKRVRLTSDEWKQMVDYLAATSAQAKAVSDTAAR